MERAPSIYCSIGPIAVQEDELLPPVILTNNLLSCLEITNAKNAISCSSAIGSV